MTIIEAMDDEMLFAKWFRGDSWRAWRVALKVLFALPLDDAELAIFRAATGRSTPPLEAATEFWICAGRRAGKSLISALIAVFLACFRDYSEFLAPGEAITIMLIAADRKQARTILRYIRAFLFETPLLARLVAKVTKESIELQGNVFIEIHTCSRVSTRSYTLGGVVNDEIGFWPAEDMVNADVEILSAQRPSMVTVPGAVMVCASSPYARRGALFSAYEAHYARNDDPVLFWKAPSRALPEHEALCEMNPNIDLHTVEQAYRDDAIAASAEWGGNFRTDVEQMFNLDMLERITDYDRPEILPPSFEEELA